MSFPLDLTDTSLPLLAFCSLTCTGTLSALVEARIKERVLIVFFFWMTYKCLPEEFCLFRNTEPEQNTVVARKAVDIK